MFSQYTHSMDVKESLSFIDKTLSDYIKINSLVISGMRGQTVVKRRKT